MRKYFKPFVDDVPFKISEENCARNKTKQKLCAALSAAGNRCFLMMNTKNATCWKRRESWSWLQRCKFSNINVGILCYSNVLRAWNHSNSSSLLRFIPKITFWWEGTMIAQLFARYTWQNYWRQQYVFINQHDVKLQTDS